MADGSPRVALVTGASSGIGRATAVLLADRGIRVMAVGRAADRLEALSAESGVDHITCSLSTPEGCEAAVAETRERLGPISILVNSAGRGGHHDLAIWDQDLAGWRETLAVNLEAPFLLSHLCAADMRDLGWGRIVMVSSTAGRVGAPSLGAYCASKHGVIGLARSIAHDVGSFGGTCNTVLPGWVRTPMAEDDVRREAVERGILPDEVWAEHDASYPRGRSLEPAEVAQMIVWLTSDEAAGVNGEAIGVALGGLW